MAAIAVPDVYIGEICFYDPLGYPIYEPVPKRNYPNIRDRAVIKQAMERKAA